MTDETPTTGKVNISDISGGDTDVGPIVTGSVGADLVGGDKVGHNKIGRDQNITVIHNYNRPVSRADEADKPSPYRGLSHFGLADAEFFFGRDAFIQELIARIDQQSFIPVLGASGSGKSSVVLAGLAPKLSESGQWRFTHFKPGEEPFGALAEALVPLYAPELDKLDQRKQARKLEQNLRQGELHLTDIVEMIQETQPGSQTLLIADQFEELFSLCPDEEIRRHFLQMLTEASQSTAAASGKAPLVIVATMRADFLGQALEYPALAEVLTQDIKLKPMTRDDLRATIEKPVEHINQTRQMKVSFEVGLVDQILDDVEKRPGNLPLLEFALALLWEARRQSGDDALLTIEAYEALGKVEGALAQHANQVYESLSPDEQEQVQYIFTHHMIQPGEGTGDTRRIASRNEVGEDNWPLVRKLADARLVEIHPPNEAGEDTAEVVHEALIRNWDRIGEWVNQIRAFLVWRKQLRFAMKRWQDTGQDEGALLRGALLKEAESWLAERETDLRQDERNFIQTSMETEKKLKRDLLALEIRAGGIKNRNLREIDLSGTYLSGVDLSRANLHRAILSDADLSGANLSGVKLREADLSGINLSGANLSRAKLREADLSGANLNIADLSGADLSRTKLSEANLSGAVLRDANLREAKIDGTTQIDDKWRLVWRIVTYGAKDLNLMGANLNGADLHGAKLNRAKLIEVALRGANLSGANLSRAMLSGADLKDANLHGAKLRGANLRRAKLRGANLKGANLREVDLSRANLNIANLSRADLSGAKLLKGATAMGVNLSEADLSEADLRGINFKRANLNQANLRQAKLSRARLNEVDLSGADLSGAKYSKRTMWPDDFDPVAAGAVKVD